MATILIVEDNATNMQLSSFLLESAEYDVLMAITAEIGLMKATEQLSAMEMMAVDPIARVVAPRFWGGVISMPLLAALSRRAWYSLR